jgi:hypothetical protein
VCISYHIAVRPSSSKCKQMHTDPQLSERFGRLFATLWRCLSVPAERLPRLAARSLWARSPQQTGSFRYGHIRSGSVAKRAVRTTLIVFETPALQDNACFAQVAEEFAVQAFIAQLIVKALNTAVLPGACWLDIERLDFLSLQPVLHAVGNKLGSVVAAQMFGHG